MNTTLRISMAALLLAVVPVPLAAQRGRRSDAGSSAKSVYDSEEYGMKFPVPPGLELFTPQEPGPYLSILKDRRIIYLVGASSRDINVSVRYSPSLTEADLNSSKDTLDSAPPQAKLPGYKKISVRFTKIGAGADKEAVEHVYTVTINDVPTTVRQVMFLHKGRGFTFICSAVESHYASADKRLFEPIFARMEFR
jgi:hypothetical protein